MKLTTDEQRALAFIAALLFLSAAVRVVGLPDPVDVPGGGGFDLAGHIEAVERAVAEEESRTRPLGPGERIDPNTATAAELDRLPRVGPALAARIVADRDANGRFRVLSDLGRVPGVGERTLELLAPHVSLRQAVGPAGSARGRARSGAAAGAAARAPLDLNRATPEELTALRGIGPVLARRIVAHRDSAGPFRAVSDLEAVTGIGPATVARLEGRLVVR